MKLNHRPSDCHQSDVESKIVETRLAQLYHDDVRSVPRKNEGIWLSDEFHVRLRDNHNLPRNLVEKSKNGYHMLMPYQALFVVESAMLFVSLDGIILSLAELFEIIFGNESYTLSEYRKFQHSMRMSSNVVESREGGNLHFLPINSNSEFKQTLRSLQKHGPKQVTTESCNPQDHVDCILADIISSSNAGHLMIIDKSGSLHTKKIQRISEDELDIT